MQTNCRFNPQSDSREIRDEDQRMKKFADNTQLTQVGKKHIFIQSLPA
jgi:hypothetical protein